MFNPYIPFEKKWVGAFQKSQETFLVTQPLPEYMTIFNQGKMPILLTQYKDEGLATIHFEAVQKLKFASIIDLTKEKHFNTIKEMLQPDSKYDLWVSITPERKKTDALVRKLYIHNMRRWIQKNTDWRVPASATIDGPIEYIFGEIYVTLQYNNNEKKGIPLKEIIKS